MPTLSYSDLTWQVDHAVKGVDYIHCYDSNGNSIVSFDGVSDFTDFAYSGTYMSPDKCLDDTNNTLRYCNGKLQTAGGATVTPSNIGAMPSVTTASGALYATENNGTPKFGVLPMGQGGTGSALSNVPKHAIIRNSGDGVERLLYTATGNGALYATAANGSPQFGTLPIAQGGTGAETAAKALANLRALNIDHITDNAFVVASGADLNNYTTPGVYKIISATVAKTLVNCPHAAAGRLIVSAAAATESVIQIGIFNNAARYQVWFRLQTSDCIWGEWTRIVMDNNSYKSVKLWENASRTSAFAEQTISIGLSGYNEVLIYYCLEGSRFNDHMVVSRCHVGETALASFIWADDDYFYHRKATTSATGIKFFDAYRNKTKDTSAMIPYRVYGIKEVK